MSYQNIYIGERDLVTEKFDARQKLMASANLSCIACGDPDNPCCTNEQRNGQSVCVANYCKNSTGELNQPCNDKVSRNTDQFPGLACGGGKCI